MDLQIASPLVVVARRVAPEDPRVDTDTIRAVRREVVGTLPHQLERDVLAIRSTGIEPCTPLFHDRIVRQALTLPGDLLVSGTGEHKWALRLAARDWLPDRLAFREKKQSSTAVWPPANSTAWLARPVTNDGWAVTSPGTSSPASTRYTGEETSSISFIRSGMSSHMSPDSTPDELRTPTPSSVSSALQ